MYTVTFVNSVKGNVHVRLYSDFDVTRCLFLLLLRSSGGTLAHAFLPRRGEAHFDMAERWTLNGHKGHNLFMVTAHEIGHTLGLDHSPVRHALMSPYYRKLGRNLVPSWDDIIAVQQLYGERTVLFMVICSMPCVLFMEERGGLLWTLTNFTSGAQRLHFKSVSRFKIQLFFVKWKVCGPKVGRSVKHRTSDGHTKIFVSGLTSEGLKD